MSPRFDSGCQRMHRLSMDAGAIMQSCTKLSEWLAHLHIGASACWSPSCLRPSCLQRCWEILRPPCMHEAGAACAGHPAALLTTLLAAQLSDASADRCIA